jgi:CDP-paratose synthetase
MTTVLLTGATGFLGSHLLRGLCQNGHSVIALKRSTSDTRRIADLMHQVRLYDSDKIPLKAIFEEQRINTVIHTATSYGRQGETVTDIVKTNLGFPLELMELCTLFNTDTFFNTDTVLPAGLNYYVLSKKQFLEYGSCLAKSSKVRFVNVRLEHMYGPGEGPTKFIPYLIHAFLAQRPYIDLTAGEQRRDFIHVQDVVHAFEILLDQQEKLSSPVTEFELGSGAALPLKDIVELIHELCRSNTELRFGALPYREGEIMSSMADISRMGRLGWMPRVDLRDGLVSTIEAERNTRTLT